MAYIFILGLILGYMRWKTGSLWTPILAHMLVNSIAMIETTLLLS